MEGHNKFKPDNEMFGAVGRKYKKSNVFNVRHLMNVVKQHCRPVLINNTNILTWAECFKEHGETKMIGVTDWRHFRFTKREGTEPKIEYKQLAKHAWQEVPYRNRAFQDMEGARLVHNLRTYPINDVKAARPRMYYKLANLYATKIQKKHHHNLPGWFIEMIEEAEKDDGQTKSMYEEMEMWDTETTALWAEELKAPRLAAFIREKKINGIGMRGMSGPLLEQLGLPPEIAIDYETQTGLERVSTIQDIAHDEERKQRREGRRRS